MIVRFIQALATRFGGFLDAGFGPSVSMTARLVGTIIAKALVNWLCLGPYEDRTEYDRRRGRALAASR